MWWCSSCTCHTHTPKRIDLEEFPSAAHARWSPVVIADGGGTDDYCYPSLSFNGVRSPMWRTYLIEEKSIVEFLG